MARHIAGHCGNRILAGVRLALASGHAGLYSRTIHYLPRPIASKQLNFHFHVPPRVPVRRKRIEIRRSIRWNSFQVTASSGGL